MVNQHALLLLLLRRPPLPPLRIPDPLGLAADARCPQHGGLLGFCAAGRHVSSAGHGRLQQPYAPFLWKSDFAQALLLTPSAMQSARAWRRWWRRWCLAPSPGPSPLTRAQPRVRKTILHERISR